MTSQHLIIESLSENNPVLASIDFLRAQFGLSNLECELFDLAASTALWAPVKKLLRLIGTEDGADIHRQLSVLLGRSRQEIRGALLPTANLVRFGMLECLNYADNLAEALLIDDGIREQICTQVESPDTLIATVCDEAKIAEPDAEDFAYLCADLDAVVKYLAGALRQRARGVNVLIHGGPGVGKSAFCRVIASRLEARLFRLHKETGDDCANENQSRWGRWQRAQFFLTAVDQSIVCTDDAQTMFLTQDNTAHHAAGKVRPSVISDWLASNPVPAIWVVNHPSPIPDIVLRSFSFFIEVPLPPPKVRYVLAARALSGSGVRPSFLRSIADNPAVTPSLLAKAADVLSLSGEREPATAEELLERTLRQHQLALGKQAFAMKPLPGTQYSIDELNIDSEFSLDEIIQALAREPSASLCFYGEPGTGKTAFAEHIAEALNRPLVRRRASDLQSKFVGTCEKNLAAMFAEARTMEAVLLLDEADSFLRSRSTTRQSWETSQVNELLQQMESHTGIFICTTNLFELIDSAAMRRFVFKLRFKAMRPEQRERMFLVEGLDGNAPALTEDLRHSLGRLDGLTPGDFAVVKRRFQMVGKRPTAAAFLAALETECLLKAPASFRRIGFLQ